jgi:hypothetical protein
MNLKTYAEVILDFAESHAQPFSSAEAYEAIDIFDDIKMLSDHIRNLWLKGLLARKKLDGFRYTYALSSAGLEGYELPDGVAPAALPPAPVMPKAGLAQSLPTPPQPVAKKIRAAVPPEAEPALPKPPKATPPQDSAGDSLEFDIPGITTSTIRVGAVRISITTEAALCA